MRKVRIGVIGVGSFASALQLKDLQKIDNAEVVALCDIVKEKAEEQAKIYGIDSVYSDYHELLARDDIEAVVLPLPDQIHRQVAVDSLHAGKHVLCEKPMALNYDDCAAMVKAEKESGKCLMIGQIGRYTPSFLKAKEILDSGLIGDLFFIESEYAHDYSKIGGQGGWRVTPEREPIIGGGCHAVDLIRSLAGNPEEVFAYANNMSLKDWPIHDCTVAIMKFPSGVIGKVMTSTGCKRLYTMRSVIYGTKGTLVFDNKSAYISLYQEQFLPGDTDRFLDIAQQNIALQIPVEVNNHNFAGEARDFCNAIEQGKPIVSDSTNGASTASVCFAIVESFKTGNKVKVRYDFID